MPKMLGESLDKKGYFTHLRQELELFEDVLDSSIAMQQALLENNTDKLDDATMQNETLIHHINVLERERINMHAGTISSLVNRLSSPFSELLSDIQQHWNELIKKLDTVKYQNAKLLISAIETNRSLLQKITTIETQKLFYEPKWSKSNSESRELFLNQKA